MLFSSDPLLLYFGHGRHCSTLHTITCGHVKCDLSSSQSKNPLFAKYYINPWVSCSLSPVESQASSGLTLTPPANSVPRTLLRPGLAVPNSRSGSSRPTTDHTEYDDLSAQDVVRSIAGFNTFLKGGCSLSWIARRSRGVLVAGECLSVITWRLCVSDETARHSDRRGVMAIRWGNQ